MGTTLAAGILAPPHFYCRLIDHWRVAFRFIRLLSSTWRNNLLLLVSSSCCLSNAPRSPASLVSPRLRTSCFRRLALTPSCCSYLFHRQIIVVIPQRSEENLVTSVSLSAKLAAPFLPPCGLSRIILLPGQVSSVGERC